MHTSQAIGDLHALRQSQAVQLTQELPHHADDTARHLPIADAGDRFRCMVTQRRDAPAGGDNEPAAIAVAEEADDYSRCVDGVAIDAVRMGKGTGPSTVQTTRVRDIIANSNTIRFPMATYATIGDDRVLAAAVTSAPPTARWCGIDITAGMVVVYGPGAEHTGLNPAGLGFAFALIKAAKLEKRADEIGSPLRMPARGQVHVLNPSEESGVLHRTLDGLAEMATNGLKPKRVEDTVVNDVVAALADDRRIRRIGARRRIDSRIVANTCIEYAESTGRIPAIRELCLVAGVSERRLRTAFNDTYGMPPAKFFRTWGLSAARRSLLHADQRRGNTVTAIALDIGFGHLGKFAGSYKELFGESPSTTLTSLT